MTAGGPVRPDVSPWAGGVPTKWVAAAVTPAIRHARGRGGGSRRAGMAVPSRVGAWAAGLYSGWGGGGGAGVGPPTLERWASLPSAHPPAPPAGQPWWLIGSTLPPPFGD